MSVIDRYRNPEHLKIVLTAIFQVVIGQGMDEQLIDDLRVVKFPDESRVNP